MPWAALHLPLLSVVTLLLRLGHPRHCLGLLQAADAESSSLHKTVESLKQDAQRALVESKQATQQWAVAQADLRSTRHQLKVLQQQVPAAWSYCTCPE